MIINVEDKHIDVDKITYISEVVCVWQHDGMKVSGYDGFNFKVYFVGGERINFYVNFNNQITKINSKFNTQHDLSENDKSIYYEKVKGKLEDIRNFIVYYWNKCKSNEEIPSIKLLDNYEKA